MIGDCRTCCPHILIRRTRKHVLRWYGIADDTKQPLRELTEEQCKPYLGGEKRAYVEVGGRHQFFPKRELEPLRYCIDATYSNLYQEIRSVLCPSSAFENGKHLTYARYGLWGYLRADKRHEESYKDLKRAGITLRGLIRTNLFKRFESSVEAFRRSLRRMIDTQRIFLAALDNGFVPAGDKADRLLGQAGVVDDDDLLDSLNAVSGRYVISDFHEDVLRKHIVSDIHLLEQILKKVSPITPDQDDKLQTFLKRIQEAPIGGRKCLVFTQFADTAEYVFENLNSNGPNPDIEVIFGAERSKARIAGRFSPGSNPDFAPRKKQDEIRLLVATDVLAEGLNLQDCNVVLNYDLHWNPVRLIQRFGRVDRIGSEHETILALNFLPETALERELGIQEVLRGRIADIHETIGEDGAVLDSNERLNENAMYAMYSEGKVEGFEDEEDDFMDLNEAEEFFRNLKKDDPEEFNRIVELRDGIRSTKLGSDEGVFVFCQAGSYNQLFLATEQGGKTIRDVPRVLEAILASPETERGGDLPKDFNKRVMAIKGQFVEEVRNQEARRRHVVKQSHAQRYVLRELRTLYDRTQDEDEKARINEMDRVFRLAPTTAVRRELNSIRRNGLAGHRLLEGLITIYHHHRLADQLEREESRFEVEDIPRIICGEALEHTPGQADWNAMV